MSRSIVCATVLLALAATASAQKHRKPAVPVEAPEVTARKEEAKARFQQGVALFNDGNFNAALVEFEASYKAHPSPSTLVNIGLTYKGMFRYVEAIATLERYMAEEQALQPARRAEIEQQVAELKALLAEVTFQIAPEGATVTLDGRVLGTAPIRPTPLPAGQHVLEVAAPGFEPHRRELTVVARQPQQVAIALKEIPKTGKVRITASQPEAEVVVDGQFQGRAPVEVELKAGGHQLEVRVKGFDSHQSEMVVVAGESRTVGVELKKGREGKFYHKWWFWTISGVVVAGLAGGIAYWAVYESNQPTMGTWGGGQL